MVKVFLCSPIAGRVRRVDRYKVAIIRMNRRMNREVVMQITP